MTIFLLTFFLLSVSYYLSSAFAQATCNSTYSWYYWAKNSLNQDPCVVAGTLLSACPGKPSLPRLSPDKNNTAANSYPTLTTDTQNSCTCSYVLYNLVSACGDCQVGDIAPLSWPSYSDWTKNCSTANIRNSYPNPVPDNTSVPLWATMTSSDTGDSHWSYGLSYALARGAVVLANSTIPSTPTQSSLPSSSPLTPSSSSCTSTSRLASISAVSGVAGLIVGAAGLATFIYLFNRRHSRRMLQPTLFKMPKINTPVNRTPQTMAASGPAPTPISSRSPANGRTSMVVEPFVLHTTPSPSSFPGGKAGLLRPNNLDVSSE